MINRINYKNPSKAIDFEIVEIQSLFKSRYRQALASDFRLNFWSLIYIVEGSGSHYIDFKAYHYQAGDILLINKNQVHHFDINSEVKGYVLHINEPFFYLVQAFNGDIFLEFTDKSFGKPLIRLADSKDTTTAKLIDMIYHEYTKSDDNVSIELLASLFQAFIISIRNQMGITQDILLTKDYENFKTYRELVEKNFVRTKNVDDYASMMHLSKKTVNQATRNVVGLSAKQFIINRVVLEIKRYLSQGQLMNYEIADKLGFFEAANMTKFFKRYEGVSPKEFKEQINKSH